MSDTPRTDSEVFSFYREDVTGCSEEVQSVPASFARELERNYDALVKGYWSIHDHNSLLMEENDTLRSERDLIKRQHDFQFDKAVRLERENAALRAKFESASQAYDNLLAIHGTVLEDIGALRKALSDATAGRAQSEGSKIVSKTPRTDAVAKRYEANEIGAAEVLIHAGQLERENAALLNDVKNAADRLLKLERENAALREQLHNRDAEIDMWASRCAAAIWMLPEQVIGGQLREAQDKFHRMLHAARKEAQP